MPLAVRAEKLGKEYRLGEINRRMLYEEVQSWWARKRGKEDPNTRVGVKRPANAKQGEHEILWALKDVSFDIQAGEVVGIIGRNGAGKSTLLKILSQITAPTEGRVMFKGRLSSLLEVGTGFHTELTGRENVYLNGTILGLTRAEIRRKFDEIAEFSGVEQFLDTPVKRYSSGMTVRLAFAVAAHLEPEIMIVDEVLAVGDSAFQKKCLGKLGEVAESGRTVLFVSHQMSAVQNLCKRVMVMKGGRLVRDGEPKALIAEYLQEMTDNTRVSLADRRDRQGSGAVHFVSVELQNEAGQPVSALHAGEKCGFLIHLKREAAVELSNVRISIGIENQLGQRVAVLDNELTGEIFPRVPRAIFAVTAGIDRLPLTGGRYFYSLFCSVNGAIADWVLQAGSFDVEGGDFYGTGRLPEQSNGTALIAHRFSIDMDSN